MILAQASRSKSSRVGALVHIDFETDHQPEHSMSWFEERKNEKEKIAEKKMPLPREERVSWNNKKSAKKWGA